jgi:hypothetical protein
MRESASDAALLPSARRAAGCVTPFWAFCFVLLEERERNLKAFPAGAGGGGGGSTSSA